MQLRKEKGSAVQPLNASKEVGGITTKPNSANKVKDLIHNTQEDDKKINQKYKSSTSERSGAVPGNSSSGGLLNESSEHLSHNALASQEDVVNISTRNRVRSRRTSTNCRFEC